MGSGATGVGVEALTIDFWNTLFGTANRAARQRQRREALVAELSAAGHQVDDERLAGASRAAMAHFDTHWLHHRRTPGSRELTEVIVAELDLEVPEESLGRIAQVFAVGVLDHPPDLLPGAREALEQLSGGVRLALISDTAFSPGAALHELMEREGIAELFGAFVFSDETGVAKPEPDAFHRALGALGVEPAASVHIGDIERTDIDGALGVGMRAILYRNEEHRHAMAEDDTSAHAVVEHWDDVAPTLERFGAPSDRPGRGG